MALVGARLQQLGDDGDGAHVQERARGERKQHVSPLETRAPDALGGGAVQVIRTAAAVSTVLLDEDADARAQKGTDGRHELGAHGFPLGEARLDEEGKVAHLVGDLVEEDGHGGRRAECRGRVERRGQGEAVGDVVREIGNQVEETRELDRGVDRVHWLWWCLGGLFCLFCLLRLVALADLAMGLGRGTATGVGGAPVRGRRRGSRRMLVRMVVTAVSPCRNSQGFVHGHERDEADNDADTQEEVAVGFEHDKFDAVVVVFTQKDLREEVEESVAQQATDGERHHHAETGRVYVRWA